MYCVWIFLKGSTMKTTKVEEENGNYSPGNWLLLLCVCFWMFKLYNQYTQICRCLYFFEGSFVNYDTGVFTMVGVDFVFVIADNANNTFGESWNKQSLVQFEAVWFFMCDGATLDSLIEVMMKILWLLSLFAVLPFKHVPSHSPYRSHMPISPTRNVNKSWLKLCIAPAVR